MYTTTCTAFIVYHSFGYFIIVSPAESLHFSALYCLVCACDSESVHLAAMHRTAFTAWIGSTQQVISCNSDVNKCKLRSLKLHIGRTSYTRPLFEVLVIIAVCCLGRLLCLLCSILISKTQGFFADFAVIQVQRIGMH